MKPRQIGDFNTGSSALLLVLALILSPIATIKAMLRKDTKQ